MFPETTCDCIFRETLRQVNPLGGVGGERERESPAHGGQGAEQASSSQQRNCVWPENTWGFLFL
jgi:hypothetical protein